MKSPLRYQATRYDCGPTTMLNAIIFLFDREEIPPDLVRHIGICAFDPYYKGNEVNRPGIEPVIHHPHSHNVILPVSLLENTGRDYYSMGELWTREALIIGREPFENMYII